MMPVLLGLAALLAGVAVALFLVIGPRRDPSDDEHGVDVANRASGLRDRVADAAREQAPRVGSTLVSRDRLDLAGISATPSTALLVVVLTVLGGGVVGAVIAALRPAPAALVILPLLGMAAAAIVLRLVWSSRVSRRRARFAEQLDGTLQLLAGGLRAGHSLTRAVEAVAVDSESPTREEFARVVNEHRLGRDLDDAIALAAERMESTDLQWTAEAVAVHREVGGNLGEVLDHVAETIRERQAVRRQVQTLSAEGRMSAIVLIVLPVVVAIGLAVISPGYLTMFVTTPLGIGLLVVSLGLFTAGALWLRAITKVSY